MKRLAQHSLLLTIFLCCSTFGYAQGFRVESKSPPAPTGITGSQNFTSKEGRFKISLPAQPSAKQFQPIKAQGTSLDSYVFAWATTLGQYVVVYVDTPKVLDDSALSKSLLDHVRDAQVAKEKGKLQSDVDISLDGHPGREFKTEVPDGLFIDRVYLVKQRMYAITAFIPTAKRIQEAEATAILNTFKLLPQAEVEAALNKKTQDAVRWTQ